MLISFPKWVTAPASSIFLPVSLRHSSLMQGQTSSGFLSDLSLAGIATRDQLMGRALPETAHVQLHHQLGVTVVDKRFPSQYCLT